MFSLVKSIIPMYSMNTIIQFLSSTFGIASISMSSPQMVWYNLIVKTYFFFALLHEK